MCGWDIVAIVDPGEINTVIAYGEESSFTRSSRGWKYAVAIG